MSQNEFDYHFARAGLAYGKESLQSYINAARGKV